jgi:hypothetical protein
MSKRSIEETFHAIQPKGRRGIPAAPTIAVGVSSQGSDLAGSLSQAGQQIAGLQAAYKEQADLIRANTQALQTSASAQGGGSSTASTVGHVASSVLGGAPGFLSPIISGIASLFGGSSMPAPLPLYVAPSPVSINDQLRGSGSSTASSVPPSYAPSSTTAAATPPANVQAPQATNPASGATASQTHVTVNISAMDSQSFMDRSSDIASAVREAMLNMHPINDVVASL